MTRILTTFLFQHILLLHISVIGSLWVCYILIKSAYYKTIDRSSTTYNAMIDNDCANLFHGFRQPQHLFITGIETSTNQIDLREHDISMEKRLQYSLHIIVLQGQ